MQLGEERMKFYLRLFICYSDFVPVGLLLNKQCINCVVMWYGIGGRHTYLLQEKFCLVVPGNILKSFSHLITEDSREGQIDEQYCLCVG